MIRRASGIVLGGRWCFPGGHIEPAETSKQAIVRELDEELGIAVEPSRKLGYIRLPEAGYILAVWRVSLVSGQLQPEPAEISQVKWVTIDRMVTMEPGLPSNAIACEMIRKAQGSQTDSGRLPY